MNAEPSFVDTNILVYAISDADAQKGSQASALISDLTALGTLRTSTQVLQELFVTLTRKVKKPLHPEAALRYLDHLSAWPVAPTNYDSVRQAIELTFSASLSFWDALIIVAAARSGAARLYSEDLQHEQRILGVQIINPFI